MAFNSKVLKAIFPVPSYTNDIPHDLWITLVANRFFKSIVIGDKLVLYRRHSSTTSDGGLKSPNSVFKRISYRFQYLKLLRAQKKYIKENGNE